MKTNVSLCKKRQFLNAPKQYLQMKTDLGYLIHYSDSQSVAKDWNLISPYNLASVSEPHRRQDSACIFTCVSLRDLTGIKPCFMSVLLKRGFSI